MKFFRQIIFEPKPKPKTEKSFWSGLLPYWFEHTEQTTRFMVRCPVCGEEYCYSVITSNITSYELSESIADNRKFFDREWETQCPRYKIHGYLEAKKDEYVQDDNIPPQTQT